MLEEGLDSKETMVVLRIGKRWERVVILRNIYTILKMLKIDEEKLHIPSLHQPLEENLTLAKLTVRIKARGNSDKLDSTVEEFEVEIIKKRS